MDLLRKYVLRKDLPRMDLLRKALLIKDFSIIVPDYGSHLKQDNTRTE
jgi:hypothetical protein